MDDLRDPVDEVPVPPPLPAAPPAPRFCRDCGSPWHPQWVQCGACARPPAAPHHQPVPAGPPLALDVAGGKDRSIPYALSLYFAWLALSLVVIFWYLLDGDPVTIDFVSSAVAAVMVFAWCVPRAARLAVAQGLRRVRPLWCLAGVAAAPVTFGIATAVVYAFNNTFDLEEVRYTDDLFDAGWGWGMSILLVCVQPAVIEEIAFRGVIFSALGQVLDAGEAVIVSALMFMIIHLSVPSFPHLLLIGLALGWLRVRTGSLIPGMCLHFTHNLLCVVQERWW